MLVDVYALPDPVFPMPLREMLERSHNVVRYSIEDLGGQFPFYKCRPELVRDLQTFVGSIGSQ